MLAAATRWRPPPPAARGASSPRCWSARRGSPIAAATAHVRGGRRSTRSLPGDVVLVRAGEVVPVDGRVASAQAVLDESALTGESLPVAVRARRAACAAAPRTRASRSSCAPTRRAAESAYAALVRLVRRPSTQRAPFVRMADRYAAFFLPVTLVLAGGAWAVERRPRARARRARRRDAVPADPRGADRARVGHLARGARAA